MQIVLNITTFFLAMYSALRQGEGKLVLYFATYGADLTFDRDNTCCCTGGWFIFRQHYDSEKKPDSFYSYGFLLCRLRDGDMNFLDAFISYTSEQLLLVIHC